MADRRREILHRYEKCGSSDLRKQRYQVPKIGARFQGKSNLLHVHTFLHLYVDDNLLLLQVRDR